MRVDLWALRDQLDRTDGTVPADRTPLEETLACYRGDFAQEVTGAWPEGPREELRREVLDAYGLLVQAAHVHDPALALLTTSLAEIGEEPSSETVALCTALARRIGPKR
ncbi:BTAD domain-containing putative transcriptional regulator [Streptomyces rimosus]|uniref:BTAD domain-containing putative transcriptional regulator n=1 Tax=Streptomyces rimosus TaxID=1927 RepID=UPI0004C8AB22|nr:BTAD domain-containing putative transcriptional regulator [Streptomyces rimosus]